ncbi:hypothetical protein ACOME3_006799 [Neoechinorhynchus agilis]
MLNMNLVETKDVLSNRGWQLMDEGVVFTRDHSEVCRPRETRDDVNLNAILTMTLNMEKMIEESE